MDAATTRTGLSRWVLLSYSLATMPVIALSMPLLVFVPPLYNELGLSFTIIGVILIVCRFFDIITDPVMGYLVDHFPSRFGYRKHWLFLCIPLLIATGYFLFHPPPNPTPAYFMFWMLMSYSCFTIYWVTHLSWGHALSGDYHERSRIYVWRQAFDAIGMFSVLLIPAIGGWQLGWSQGESVGAMGWFISIMALLCLPLCLAAVPDRQLASNKIIGAGPGKQSRESLKAMAALLRQSLARRLVGSETLSGMAPGATAALYVPIMAYSLQLGWAGTLTLLPLFFAGFLFLPIWMWLAHRLGKRNTLMIALCYCTLSLLSIWLFLVPKEFWRTLVLMSTYGVGLTAVTAMTRAMMQDIVDQHELDSGQNQAGFANALMTTANKLGLAAGGGTVYLVTGLVLGFDQRDPSTHTVANLEALKALWLLFPAAAYAVALLPMFGYWMTASKHLEVCRQLEQRRERGGSDAS